MSAGMSSAARAINWVAEGGTSRNARASRWVWQFAQSLMSQRLKMAWVPRCTDLPFVLPNAEIRKEPWMLAPGLAFRDV